MCSLGVHSQFDSGAPVSCSKTCLNILPTQKYFCK